MSRPRSARVRRGGAYYRVCDPSWDDPSDTSFSMRYGGRWNPPGEFGALYLNATPLVAAANARRHIERLFGDVVTLFDLTSEHQPDLQAYDVADEEWIDCVTVDGLRSCGLPETYQIYATADACHRVARDAYSVGEAGIAAKSAVLPAGEELAVFDASVGLARTKERLPFGRWYPSLIPE